MICQLSITSLGLGLACGSYQIKKLAVYLGPPRYYMRHAQLRYPDRPYSILMRGRRGIIHNASIKDAIVKVMLFRYTSTLQELDLEAIQHGPPTDLC